MDLEGKKLTSTQGIMICKRFDLDILIRFLGHGDHYSKEGRGDF